MPDLRSEKEIGSKKGKVQLVAALTGTAEK